MGLSYYRFGHILPCSITKGYVCFKLPSGKVIQCATNLHVELPEQVNHFRSPYVMFLLYDDEKEYIGRYDGSISIYKKGTNLLVGLNNWVPPECEICQVGWYGYATQLFEIYLNKLDMSTLYTNRTNQFVSDLTFTPSETALETALALVSSKRNTIQNCLCVGGGVVNYDIEWDLSSGYGWEDLQIFV